jgi:hypothetical protein
MALLKTTSFKTDSPDHPRPKRLPLRLASFLSETISNTLRMADMLFAVLKKLTLNKCLDPLYPHRLITT